MEKVRGVWLTNVDSKVLNTAQTIKDGMKLLADTGFNYVFPVVWNKGFTLYPSKIMHKVMKAPAGDNFQDILSSSVVGDDIDPAYAGRDPLQEVIDAAHDVGLKVIPWFEFGFACSFETNGGRIIAKRPGWAAKDRDKKLLKKNGFEWMNALDEDVQNFILYLILELVQNYQVEGIQGDDRLPALPSEGGYDTKTEKLYFDRFDQNPPLNTKDKTWLEWRAGILTNFLVRLRQEVHAVKPGLTISMAPSPFPFGFNEHLQDYPTWLSKGLVDMIHPQLYRHGLNAYKALVDDAVDRFNQDDSKNLLKLFPGVLSRSGDFHIDPNEYWQCIKHNRSSGIRGEVMFFFEELLENKKALANLLVDKNYAEFVFLRRGHEGPDVEEVQRQLVSKGYALGLTDGKFGSRTEDAVIKFQKDFDVRPFDGIVGPLTYAKLFA